VEYGVKEPSIGCFILLSTGVAGIEGMFLFDSRNSRQACVIFPLSIIFFGLMIFVVLLTLFFLLATNACYILEETPYIIRCNIPPSVSKTLQIPSTFVFLKLSNKTTIQTIFTDYTTGRFDQIDIFRVLEEIQNQISHGQVGSVSRVEFESWAENKALNLRERYQISRAVIKLTEPVVAYNTPHLLKPVFDILNRIRGSRGFIEFANLLASIDDAEWIRMETAVRASPLRVTEYKSTIRVDLPSSIALELRATSFHLLKIDDNSYVGQIYNEYRRGSRELIRILEKQRDLGILSLSQYISWYSHKSLMLEERRCIISALKMIKKCDSSLKIYNGIAIFEWIMGSLSLIEFAHLLMKNGDPAFWEHAVSSYNSMLDMASRDYIEIPLPPMVAAAFESSHYKLVQIKQTTGEEVLVEEYSHGFYGQLSLGISFLSTKLRIPLSYFGYSIEGWIPQLR
jgi:hypothetical protein